MDYYTSKKDLETFSSADIKVLVNHYNIQKTANKDDTLWQLAVAILGNTKSGQMAPAKVFEKYGPQLFEKAKTDQTVRDTNPEAIKLKFIEMDPDSGKNVEWLVTSYINGGIRAIEDLGRANVAIKKYNWLVGKKLLDPADPNLQYFKTLVDFGGIVGYTNKKGQIKIGLESFLDKYRSKLTEFEKPTTKSVTETDRIVHYQDDSFTLIEPLTETASCKYGANTRWCTAGRENNQFENYSQDGPILIIIPKKEGYPGEKYQLHFESNSFMNEQDNDVLLPDLHRRFPTLKHALRVQENNYISSNITTLPDSLKKLILKDNDPITNINNMSSQDFENVMIQLITEKSKLVDKILNTTTQNLSPKVLEILNPNNDKLATFISNGIVKLNDQILDTFNNFQIAKIGHKINLDNLSDQIFEKVGQGLVDGDYQNIEKALLATKRHITPNIVSRLAHYEMFDLILQLVADGKVDLDKPDKDGRTIVSHLNNIDQILKVIPLKKVPLTKTDLINIPKTSIQFKDFVKLEQYYTPEEFTNAVLNKYVFDNHIEQVIAHPKVALDKILPIALCHSGSIIFKPENIGKLLASSRYPAWTRDNNPLKIFLEPFMDEGEVCQGSVSELKIILDNPNAGPFLKSLSATELQDLVSAFEKLYKPYGRMILNKL